MAIIIRIILSVVVVTFYCAASAFAAANVSVTPSGDSSYSVMGSGMSGVAGIQLDITYDITSLSNPTVTQGGLVSGAMLAANTNQPGKIRIAIISTNAFSGSGQIATIIFAGKSGTGGISSATVSMIDSKGAAVAATASITGNSGNNNIAGLSDSPGVPSSPSTSTVQPEQIQTNTTNKATSTTTPTYLGAVTLPSDLQQRIESPPLPTSAMPVATTEPTTARTSELPQPAAKTVADAKPEETPQYIVYKGISDRFKQNNGSKKLSDVVALFDKKVAQTIVQSPAIVLSNGQNKALLTVDIPARISASPNFAVNGGSLVTFKQDKQQKGRWLVEVLPETGSTKVSVTIIVGAEQFEYPLTIAPAVKTALTLDEKGWNKFIKETGTTAAPLHDFNSDGVRDYLDEYIFAANILTAKSTLTKPAAKPRKSAK
jgi:hypothetical protein